MNLSDVTWTDVAGAETSLGIVPVGATEQHGPHCPLGTDNLNAAAVAEAGVRAHENKSAAAEPVVVAPPIPVGISEEHRQFPGTLWVSPNTFRSYVRETVESLVSHGFDRVVIVNGHGGNADALREVAAGISREGEAIVVPFTWFEHVPDDAPPMGHGGPRETALVRYAHPSLVREDRVDEAREGASDGWGEWVEGINLAYDSAAFTANGVVGDPAAGTAAVGERLLAGASEALARVLAAIASREPTVPDRRDGG